MSRNHNQYCEPPAPPPPQYFPNWPPIDFPNYPDYPPFPDAILFPDYPPFPEFTNATVLIKDTSGDDIDATGGSMHASIQRVGNAAISGANLPIDIAANTAGNLSVDLNAQSLSVGLGTYSAQATGTTVRSAPGQGVGVSGGLYASSVFVDEDASGDNPQTNTVIIAAPGSNKRLVIDGYCLTIAAGAAGSYGNMILTDGDAGSPATGNHHIVIASRAQTTVPFVLSPGSSFTPIGLAENSALKLTTTEGSGQLYIYGVIYFRTIDS